MSIRYEPIGTIRTPFQSVEDMPIQPIGADSVRGTVELRPEHAEGLADLEGFSHLILLYHFHRVGPPRLRVTPFLDDRPHGVFATRAPTRPNPIGLSVVRLVGIDGPILTVENVDVLDGTPLLDVKPYVPRFDAPQADAVGWLEDVEGEAGDVRSDGRFG